MSGQTLGPMPRGDYGGSWTELRGYVVEATTDGHPLKAGELLAYMDELKHKALAPIREWMAGRRRGDYPRTFTGYRPNPPAEYAGKGTANPPDEPQYEGVIFTDGTVVVRWLTAYRSHSVWACWEDFYAVHGHPEYGTRIVFADGGEAP